MILTPFRKAFRLTRLNAFVRSTDKTHIPNYCHEAASPCVLHVPLLPFRFLSRYRTAGDETNSQQFLKCDSWHSCLLSGVAFHLRQLVVFLRFSSAALSKEPHRATERAAEILFPKKEVYKPRHSAIES